MFRRFVLSLLAVISFLPSLAVYHGSTNAVTMVSYEQSWLDDEGTLALKNNLDVDINNVAFRINYLDMSGNQLDYADFEKNVHIAPGMTKKVNIPSYEYDRHYHYYKTKDEFGHPAFKIVFEMKDYNFELKDDIEDFDDDFVTTNSSVDDNYYTTYILIGIVIILIFIGISVGLYVLVAVMAQKRNRSVVIWILLSLLATPLLMAIILLFIGEAEEREV